VELEVQKLIPRLPHCVEAVDMILTEQHTLQIGALCIKEYTYDLLMERLKYTDT